MERLGKGAQPQHIGGRAVVHKKYFGGIAEILFKKFFSSFGKFIATVRTLMFMIGLYQCIHDFRVDSGVVIAGKCFHAVKEKARMNALLK